MLGTIHRGHWVLVLLAGCQLISTTVARADDLTVIEKVAAQPLVAHVRQVQEALEYLGSPLPDIAKAKLEEAFKAPDDGARVRAIQDALDPYCLIGIQINPESRVKAQLGAAAPRLLEQGWRQYLIKVNNQAGVTAELKATSPNAGMLWGAKKETVPDQWLEMKLFNDRPVQPKLSGLEVEYRVIQLYSRDEGKRSAKIAFNVGQGTQDLGFRGEVTVLFDCEPSTPVTLKVVDENGQPATAGFEIRDTHGHVYPSQAKRLAPDFAFHPQVYRADGEVIKLPAGAYTVGISRGPEYLAQMKQLTVAPQPQTFDVKLQRWIDPTKLGYWSGDHHIHAAGCAHYTNPTEGVLAADMMRQCSGEDLKVGCNLTWGPCFDYQKQFFTGQIDKVSSYPYLIRYDIEVSGFGSHQSGHLCLLRLKDQMYPGGNSDKHWPTLCLNTLRWAKKQGAVCGPAHSGWGLQVRESDLPSYKIPPYDGIGANEYIVDVTHEVPGPDGKNVPAVDFMSTVDTPYVWELNMWYQTLNCGFRTRASGETDFPCIYGERVGLGRSYVKLGDKLDFDAWCEGIRAGKNYVSDGRSHLMDFRVENAAMGEGASELPLNKPGTVHATAKVAALLPEKTDGVIRRTPYSKAPYWHIERARIGEGREVKVELLVNGIPVASQNILADGTTRDIVFDAKIDRSSWVAMRILPSSHTNPVFVIVDGKPIRASRRSAKWCLDGVDVCWNSKVQSPVRSNAGFIAPAEMADAKAAYEHARETYRKILAECEVD